MIDAKENIRLQKIIAIIAIVLFFIKLIAWYMTRSLAILTDALESVLNIVSGLLGLYSLQLSAKPKDVDHPYGHGKVEFITVAVEGTLITIAGFFIIFKSVNSFYHPHTITKMDFGIILIA